MTTEQKTLPVRLLMEGAKLPTRAHATDAGLDLYAAHSDMIEYTDSAIIDTGISIEIPAGYYGQVASRSGLGFNNQVVAFPGIIDSGYRGSLKVLLFNHGFDSFLVEAGQKIAQLLILPCALLQPVEVTELSGSERGVGGFGSTGKPRPFCTDCGGLNEAECCCDFNE